MAIFAVMSRSENQRLREAIGKVYPDKNCEISESSWLVSDKVTAQQVCNKLGISKEGIKGVVVMPTTNSYYGVASTQIWDWLRSTIEAEGDD